LATYQKKENLGGRLLPMQEPAWNKGIRFGINIACGSELATIPTIADRFIARRRSNDASTALFFS